MREIIGLIGAGLIAISLWQTERVWLHRINSIGSGLLLINALMIPSISFITANVILLGVNIYKLTQNNTPKEQLHLIPRKIKRLKKPKNK